MVPPRRRSSRPVRESRYSAERGESTANGVIPSFRAKRKIRTVRRVPAARSRNYKYTDYFEKQVLRKRPYLRKEWCIFVLENAARSERQDHNRFRFWAPIPELGGRYLRVITLADRVTIHNAFPDRAFTP